MDPRVVDLEIRYTHQERLLEELSDVVAQQGRAIERLTKEVTELRARVAELGDDRPGNEPPPHY